MRLAILEDDEHERQLIVRWLEQSGHACHAFPLARPLLHALTRESFDLVLLDWHVPDMDGLQVLIRIRATIGAGLPVIFVTADGAESAVVRALGEGADDFLVKPVRRQELVARIQAVARRAHAHSARAEVISSPPYRLDIAQRSAFVGDTAVELTEKEFDVAVFLFRHLGKVVSRGHILEQVWGRSPDIQTRTVDTHVSRLRTKLRLSPENGMRLTSVYSYGYRLEALQDER